MTTARQHRAPPVAQARGRPPGGGERRPWWRALDPYPAALAGTVALAALLPATGRAARGADLACDLAVGLLFFLYGARLSTHETVAGLRRLRLHGLVLASTFVLFPLLGAALTALVPGPLSEQLRTGVLFLCLVPSTVQSSVALTGAARGDVPASICAGAYSSLVGLVLTPLLAAWLLGARAALSADGLLRLCAQLLAPFVVGQLLRPWIGGFLARHRRALAPVDRGSILLVVYTAFSGAMAQDVWSTVTPIALLALAGVLLVLLAAALAAVRLGARLLGLDRASAIAAVLCGSQKSLAGGLPMAAVLFGPQAGLLVLPLMMYHQLQLVAGALLAGRWARTAGSPPDGAGSAAAEGSTPPARASPEAA
ncbi:bile acid:sodium symporter family protein [Kitasatospora purpeofusca]|uniref:bile acid:sodium symporter family protein n=1 Tax=Kitasatospora purpeofusca TaxID=67352 RepID=UPI0036D3CFA6